MLRELNAEEEVRYLRELHGPENTERILATVVEQYATLQNRSQTLLGLVTICLTISGFSGPSVAASSPAARWCISVGLALVLLAAVVTLAGPLQLRWATQWRGATDEDSLVSLIRNRNRRTRRYNLAFRLLVLGLSGYVGSLVSYLLSR